MSLTERSRSSSKLRPYLVTIRSYEAPDMRFEINYRSTGKDLFELVCRTIGLREVWYFGLQYYNDKGDLVWLKLHKKVSEVKCSKRDSPALFYLRIKFYPEDVSKEVIQDITYHYMFCQIKHSIISMDIYCPPESTVLLASYALQAKYGYLEDFSLDAETFSKEDLIPQRVLDQFQMSPEMWIEKIEQWHCEVKGITKENAKLEYLKVVQDLEMYGVNYFQIKNKKKTDLWLGVTSSGLYIYELDNRLQATIAFPWNEVKDVTYKDRKFIIKMNDKKSTDFTFMVEKAKTNKIILDLCQGNYELFMNRKEPDNMEIQQIKIKANEEKMLKMMEREMLSKEKKLREAVEKKQQEQEEMMRFLENKYLQLQGELQTSRDALMQSELTAELLNEKVSLIEEEVKLLKLKEAEAEIEKQELQLTSIKTEEEKVFLEKRAVEAELMAVQIVEECDRRTKEANNLKVELTETRIAEEEARNKFHEFVKLYVANKFQSFEPSVIDVSSGDISQILPTLDVNSLSREIDKDRSEFLEKGQHLQKQLKNLKSEIEVLKVGEKQSHLNELHEQPTLNGDKFMVLGKIKVGTTKSRVQYFEDL